MIRDPRLYRNYACLVELVDTTDLKSVSTFRISVQVR